MGISSAHTIVVYATAGSFSAPRCWWTFRTFGHEGVHVLDGGLPAWTEIGGALENGVPERKSTRPSPGLVQPSGNVWKLRDKGFRARLNAPMLRTWRQVHFCLYKLFCVFGSCFGRLEAGGQHERHGPSDCHRQLLEYGQV